MHSLKATSILWERSVVFNKQGRACEVYFSRHCHRNHHLRACTRALKRSRGAEAMQDMARVCEDEGWSDMNSTAVRNRLDTMRRHESTVSSSLSGMSSSLAARIKVRLSTRWQSIPPACLERCSANVYQRLQAGMSTPNAPIHASVMMLQIRWTATCREWPWQHCGRQQ